MLFVKDQDPLFYHNIQKLGDKVFGTEPIQVSQMIDGAYLIPHPTNTKELKLFKPSKSNHLAVVYNPYDKNLYHTTLMTQRLKDEFKLRAKLLNYIRPNKLEGYYRNYYDSMVGLIPFKEWIMEICTSKFGYMPHLFHSYNRAGVEFASIGIPVVGSDRSYSLQICYPDLICNPLDFKKTRELFSKLKNENFSEEISKKAKENAEYFNYENSKKRFMEMIE